ncbi:hypothetical protein AB0C13_39760 [Streptomyces sp. NPDC049099]
MDEFAGGALVSELDVGVFEIGPVVEVVKCPEAMGSSVVIVRMTRWGW